MMLVGTRVFKVPSYRNRGTFIVGVGALSVLSILIKPSFHIAFLPATGILVLYAAYRRRTVDWWLFLGGIAIPSTAVLLWQFSVSFAGGDTSGIAPLEVVLSLARYEEARLLVSYRILVAVVVSLLFPAVVAYLYWREGAKSAFFRMSWLTLAFGLFYAYFWKETEEAFSAGNFFQSAHIAVFVLYVSSAFLLLKQPRSIQQDAAWEIFGIHVLAGTFYTLIASGGNIRLT